VSLSHSRKKEHSIPPRPSDINKKYPLSGRLEAVHDLAPHQPGDFMHPATVPGVQFSTQSDLVSSSQVYGLDRNNGPSKPELPFHTGRPATGDPRLTSGAGPIRKGMSGRLRQWPRTHYPRPIMEALEIREIMLASDFLNGLNPEQIDSILPVCRIMRYEAGEGVYAQGGSGDSLFIIADGQVVLERAVSLGARKGTVAVAIIGKGKLFGAWSTLLGESHRLMLTAVCQKPTRLVAIKGGALRTLMNQDIRLGFVILEKLCFLLRERILHTLGAMENI
jgi:hypothetical protein